VVTLKTRGRGRETIGRDDHPPQARRSGRARARARRRRAGRGGHVHRHQHERLGRGLAGGGDHQRQRPRRGRTISFQIPAPGSAKIIVQSSPLPAITQAVTIDGASQGGIAATPISIDGAGNTGATDGVMFNGGGSASTFDHVTVKDFPGDGIDVPFAQSSGVTIAADVLRGNGQAGIHLGSQASGTKVTGSDIGNDGTTANPNGAAGVNIDQASASR
jgi:hypothetical protein